MSDICWNPVSIPVDEVTLFGDQIHHVAIYVSNTIVTPGSFLMFQCVISSCREGVVNEKCSALEGDLQNNHPAKKSRQSLLSPSRQSVPPLTLEDPAMYLGLFRSLMECFLLYFHF